MFAHPWETPCLSCGPKLVTKQPKTAPACGKKLKRFTGLRVLKIIALSPLGKTNGVRGVELRIVVEPKAVIQEACSLAFIEKTDCLGVLPADAKDCFGVYAAENGCALGVVPAVNDPFIMMGLRPDPSIIVLISRRLSSTPSKRRSMLVSFWKTESLTVSTRL